jgi:hypothetical protein
MRSLATAALISLALLAIDARLSVHAGAWCAALPGGKDCGFATFEQCMVSARSDGGTCYRNPSAPATNTESAQPQSKSKKKQQ